MSADAPSDPSTKERISLTFSSYSSTAAPPPSPRRTAVLRSLQSTQPDRCSAPISSTRLAPVSSRPWAVRTPYMNPLQAAFRSIDMQVIPRSLAIIGAVAGAMRSGVVVARMSTSMSLGLTPASFIASVPARTASSRVELPIRRSRIPVRSLIHSSEVSRVLERSSLVTMFSGRPIPQPVKRTPIRDLFS